MCKGHCDLEVGDNLTILDPRRGELAGPRNAPVNPMLP